MARPSFAAYARLGFAEQDFNIFGHALALGTTYTGLIPGRDDDRLGLGAFIAFTGSDFRRAGRQVGTDIDGAETVVELTYRVQVAPWLAIQPDLQYIDNTGANTNPRVDSHALALGARLEIAL